MMERFQVNLLASGTYSSSKVLINSPGWHIRSLQIGSVCQFASEGKCYFFQINYQCQIQIYKKKYHNKIRDIKKLSICSSPLRDTCTVPSY